jgi:hypothetical protein
MDDSKEWCTLFKNDPSYSAVVGRVTDSVANLFSAAHAIFFNSSL